MSAVDRGQTNAENKLFVGGVPPGCGDKELRALFNTYGEVLDVYILASKGSQEGQRGCAFVRYSQPTSCTMAIEALHGKYAMKAGELPLVVRYADPPKNQRGGGGYGRFPPGWSPSPAVWPAGPPPMGWPIPPWGGGVLLSTLPLSNLTPAFRMLSHAGLSFRPGYLRYTASLLCLKPAWAPRTSFAIDLFAAILYDAHPSVPTRSLWWARSSHCIACSHSF